MKRIAIVLLLSFFLTQGTVFALAAPPAGNDPTPPGNDPTPPPGNDPVPPPGNDPTPPSSPGNDPVPPPGNDPSPPPPPGNDPTPPPGNDPVPPPGNDPIPPEPPAPPEPPSPPEPPEPPAPPEPPEPPEPPAPPPAPPTVDIKANNSDGPIIINYNTPVTLTWNSVNAYACQASGDWSGVKPTSGTEATTNLTSTKTYTISCAGAGGFVSDSVTVNVGLPTLSLIFSAIPAIGPAPLFNVDLRAQVAGTAIGDINYQFDCTSDGVWEKEIATSTADYTALDLCSYSSSGIFTPKARITRAGLIIEGTTMVIVQ